MGNIDIEDAFGDVYAESSMGNIDLNNPDARSEDARTNMGRIKNRASKKSKACGAELKGIPKRGPFDL